QPWSAPQAFQPARSLPGIARRQKQRIGSETGRQELWRFGVMGAFSPMIGRNRAAGLGGCALGDQRRDRRQDAQSYARGCGRHGSAACTLMALLLSNAHPGRCVEAVTVLALYGPGYARRTRQIPTAARFVGSAIRHTGPGRSTRRPGE